MWSTGSIGIFIAEDAAGKQDILDTLIEVLEKHYQDHSIFTNANWEDPGFTKDKKNMTAKKLSDIIVGQIRYIIHDPEIMAAQLAWPISMWTNLCDREPERENEAMENIKKHVKQFFKLYKK